MSPPDDPGFLLWLLLLIPVGDLAATAFFAHLFWISKHEPVPGSEQTLTTARFNHPLVRWVGRPLRYVLEGRSWLLALLTGAFAIITLVFVVVGFFATRRILGLDAFAGSGLIVGMMLLLLGAIPPAFMWAFWQTRRSRGGPPPFGERD